MILTALPAACFFVIGYFFQTVQSTPAQNVDPCSQYETCSTCTTAKYTVHEDKTSYYQYEKSILGSQAKQSSISRDSASGHKNLRRLSNEQFLLRINQPSRRQLSCSWCAEDNSCRTDADHELCASALSDAVLNTSVATNRQVTRAARYYECDCPLAPLPYPLEPPTLLPNWMGTFLNETQGGFGNKTIMDLSLPGTHDSLTYDLSLTISEDAIGTNRIVNDVLHLASGGLLQLLPGDLEDFLRSQSKTQQLNIVQQLDNGVRFVDFRLMLETQTNAWFSVHFMQSRQTASHYFLQIREWLDVHHQEIIVLWLSKHGVPEAVGFDQYPGVSPKEKQRLWKQYENIFRGLLFDARYSSVNETSIDELLRRNHRVITYVSDYKEFTDSSPLALDGADIENPFGVTGGVFDEPNTLENQIAYFLAAPRNNIEAKKLSRYSLMAMNTAGQSWQIMTAAQERFLRRTVAGKAQPLWDQYAPLNVSSCGLQTRIPGVLQWCPPTLLDVAQLSSYYNQIAFDKSLEWSLSTHPNGTSPAFEFPNAFYLDALDYDGTIRTGSRLLFGSQRVPYDDKYSSAGYAYVDTILLYNLNKICMESNIDANEPAFGELLSVIRKRIERNPLRLWNNSALGRHANWPQVNLDRIELLRARNPWKPSKRRSSRQSSEKQGASFQDTWWGAIAPLFTFPSFFGLFISRLKYHVVAAYSAAVLRFQQ